MNVMKHAAAFHQLGHEVEVLTVRGFHEDKVRRRRGFDIGRWYGIDGVKAQYFPAGPVHYFRDFPIGKQVRSIARKSRIARLRSLVNSGERSIARYCAEHGTELAYCRALGASVFCVEAGIPTVLETHEPDPASVRAMQKLVPLFSNRDLRKVATTHGAIGDRLYRMGVPKSKILVAENAADLDVFHALVAPVDELRKDCGIPQDKNVIMYVGSLKPGKGIGKILATAAAMKDQPDALFVVLGGDASEVGAWKREAERVGVANVVFTGFKENADVAKFMKCADILFMPHDLAEKRSVMDIETTSPIKLFEYMAAGKPIVTSDLPTISKVLTHGENGVLVSPPVPYDEPIRWLISNQRSAERLGANAKTRARDFTYRKRAEKILS